MKSFYFLVLSGFLINGCTVYRSEGRKQFESAAPAKVSATSFKLVACESNDASSMQLNDDLPTETYELLLSQSGLTLWRDRSQKSLVEIKARQQTDEHALSCTYHFQNEETWNSVKAQFISELETRWMSAQ